MFYQGYLVYFLLIVDYVTLSIGKDLKKIIYQRILKVIIHGDLYSIFSRPKQSQGMLYNHLRH